MMTTFFMSCIVPGGKDGPSLLDGIVVQLLNHVQLFVTPWTAARQASLSFITSQRLHKLMSIDAIQLSHPLSHPYSALIFSGISVFFSESALCIRWPKYWRFSFSMSPSSAYSGLISFRID